MNKSPEAEEVDKAELPVILRRSLRILQLSSKRVNNMQSPGKTTDADLNKDIPVKPGDRPVLQMRFGADKIHKIESNIENRCSDQATCKELTDATQNIFTNQAVYSNFMGRLNFYLTPTYESDHYKLIDNEHIDKIRKINNKAEHKNKDAPKKTNQENNVQKSISQQKSEHEKNNYGYFEVNNPSQPFTSSSFDIDSPIIFQKNSVNSNVTTQDDFIPEVIIIDEEDSGKSLAQSQVEDINKYDSCALTNEEFYDAYPRRTESKTISHKLIDYDQEDNLDSEQSVALTSECIMLKATHSSQITKQKKPDSDDNPLNNDSGKESVKNYDHFHNRKYPILCLKDVNKAKLDELESNSPKNIINEKSNATCKLSLRLSLNNDKDLKDKSPVKKKRKCPKKKSYKKKKQRALQKKTAQTTKMKLEKINGELDQLTSNHCVILPQNYQTQECWDSDPNQINNNENTPKQIANRLDQDNRLELYGENSTLSKEESIDLHNPNQQFNTDVFTMSCEQVCIFEEHENREATSEDTFIGSYDKNNTFSNKKLIDIHHSNQLDIMSSINCQQVFHHVSPCYETSANRDLVEIQSTSKIDVATNTSPVQVMSLDMWQDFYKILDKFSSKNEDEKRKLRAKLMKQKLKKEKQSRRKMYLKKRNMNFDEPNNVSPYIPNVSFCLPGDEIARKECAPSTSTNQHESYFDSEIDLPEYCPKLRLCDYTPNYYGIKDTSVDYTTLQNRILMRDAVKFQDVLIERVNHEKYLIQTARPDTAVKKFIEKLCHDKFLRGNCNNPSCILIHKLPRNWCNELAENSQTWLIANILFNQCIKPSLSMYKAVLYWLGQKEKDKYKVLLISEYILHDDSISNREDIWSIVIKVFLCCQLDVWESVSWLLIYHCKENGAETANKIIASTGILNRCYSNFWPSVRPLTQLGIELPVGVIEKVLKEVCANDKKEVFMPIPKISISQINNEVNNLSQENASKLQLLISSFRKIYNKYFPIAKKSCLKKAEEPPRHKKLTSDFFETEEIPPFRNKSFSRVMEHDKITASLIRAINVRNASSIAQTIMKYCKTEQYQDFMIQTLSDLIPQHKAFSLTKAIFHQINPGYEGRKAKKILARLCVTQIMELTEEKQWYRANDFLLLTQKNHVNPVISKPVGYVCPQVKVAIACSEINYYNKNYDSAIELLISHNLLTADTSKWKIEGDSADFELIVEHVSFLFTSIIDCTNVTKILFSKIMEIQNDLTIPIDLVDFYEPLLCNMIENNYEYKDQIIPFYTQVSNMDSTLFLTGLTYRALLVLSYRINNHLFSKEMLSKAIQRLVYSPLDKEENTVIIKTCMEQEEMEVYLIEWLRWFDRKNTCGSKSQLKIKFQLSRTVDHVENKELTIPSLILHSDDRLNPAICRMKSILDNFPSNSHFTPDVRLKYQTLFIPATSFKLLIKAAKEAY